MHHNYITAEVLYSTRTLVVNVSQLLALKVFHFRPDARIPLGHDGPLFASIRAICVLPHQLDGKRSTWCALVKTKNRSLLQHRWFNIEYVTFTTWCRKTDVTKWSELPQSRGSSRRNLLSIWNIACGHQMAAWTLFWANCRSQVRVRAASDFGLNWPPKMWHLFALSVIAGTDNQQMTVPVRVRQVSADRR